MKNNLPGIQFGEPEQEITIRLNHISLNSGFPVQNLFNIWLKLPTGDHLETTYLDAANQCILELSELVDSTYPGLIREQRVSLKLRLMGELLKLKAEHIR